MPEQWGQRAELLLWHVFFDRNPTSCPYSDIAASAVLIRLDLLYLGQKQSMQKAIHILCRMRGRRLDKMMNISLRIKYE